MKTAWPRPVQTAVMNVASKRYPSVLANVLLGVSSFLLSEPAPSDAPASATGFASPMPGLSSVLPAKRRTREPQEITSVCLGLGAAAPLKPRCTRIPAPSFVLPLRKHAFPSPSRPKFVLGRKAGRMQDSANGMKHSAWTTKSAKRLST